MIVHRTLSIDYQVTVNSKTCIEKLPIEARMQRASTRASRWIHRGETYVDYRREENGTHAFVHCPRSSLGSSTWVTSSKKWDNSSFLLDIESIDNPPCVENSGECKSLLLPFRVGNLGPFKFPCAFSSKLLAACMSPLLASIWAATSEPNKVLKRLIDSRWGFPPVRLWYFSVLTVVQRSSWLSILKGGRGGFWISLSSNSGRDLCVYDSKEGGSDTERGVRRLFHAPRGQAWASSRTSTNCSAPVKLCKWEK